MSKQLLHAHPRAVVAALGDRAYALLLDGDGDDGSPSSVVAVELLPAAAAVTNGDDGTLDGGAAEEGGGAGKSFAVDAVCAAAIDSQLWLAASREDKTLCLYSPLPSAEEEAKDLRPAVAYRLPKRAKCLAFASVPSSSVNGHACHVIIAGDAAGDARAFPVPASASSTASAATATAPAAAASHPRRLLLGHTASILTGLAVAPAASNDGTEGGQQLLLTADRDEKVRVSRFPDAHHVHGYLLGNTSFISTMDAAAAPSNGEGGRALCVTGSGNGAVLLWDYESCKQVGTVPVVMRTESTDDHRKRGAEDDDGKRGADEGALEGAAEGEGGEGGAREGPDDEGSDDFDDEDDEDGSSLDGRRAIATPISVSLGPAAAQLAVARDGLSSVDVHPLPPPPPASSASASPALSPLISLHRKQTIQCPSQPLAVRCLADGSVAVLATEPGYLLHYRRTNGGAFEDVSASSPLVAALRDAVKSQNIVMPETNLETYNEGQRRMQKTTTSGGENGSAKDGATRGGPHWNDGGRRDTAKEAERRRRKRRRDGAKMETAEAALAVKEGELSDGPATY